MVVSVKVDTREMDRAVRRLSESMRRQVPFAAAVALTRTAKHVERALQAETKRVFDQPTPYIHRGTFSTSANRNSLQAWVGMRDQSRRGASPALYVREQFEGGERGQKPFERKMMALGILPPGMRAVPGAGIKVDRYGNPNRREISEMIGSLGTSTSVFKGRGRRMRMEGYFVVRSPMQSRKTAHLAPGIWRRIERGRDRFLVPMFLFVRSTSYSARIDLRALTTRELKKAWQENFRTALANAMATAR